MNNNSHQHSGFRRWGMRIVWTLVSLLLIGLVLRLSLKTQTVQQWVKNYIVSSANQQLKAQLSIERLSGDLWSRVQIYDIRLMQEDMIAQIDSVHAAYDIWSLFNGQILLSDLQIFQPKANLLQTEEGWNVQNLVPVSGDTAGGTFPFKIDNLVLREGQVSVRSESLPDSSFAIRNITLSSSLGYSDEDYQINLRELSFAVENTELEESLKVQTSATAQNDRITLEKLVFATGNSMVQSKGYASPMDSTLQFDLRASPISWKDISSYARGFPLRQDAQVDLSITGRPEQFVLALTLESRSAKSVEVNGRFQWQSSLVLRQLQLKADYLDMQDLLADTTLPIMQNLDASFSGQVDLGDYQNGHGDVAFSANNIVRSPYELDAVSGEGTVANQAATLNIEAQQDRQKVNANLQAGKLWSDLPSVTVSLEGDHIDPSFWMQDSSYAGDLSFRSEMSGQGWYPQNRPWNYSLEMTDSQFMGQPITNFSAEGQVSRGAGTLDASLKIREGIVEVSADLRDMIENPAYNYSIKTRNLDLASLAGRSDFKTAVNGKVAGRGRGFDPATMQLQSSVEVDSSLINKELLRNLSAEISIRDSVAKIDSARLQSTIAEGAFNLRFNLLHRFDTRNKLDLDLRLKDMNALAPLVGVESLNAEGTIKGELNPTNGRSLRFLGKVDLSDVQYNELFSTDRARGALEVRIRESLAYFADLDLSGPIIYGVQLQDLALRTDGSYADSSARGGFKLQFSGPNEGRIEQGGTYLVGRDSAKVRTTEFNIISDYRTLTLERPFALSANSDSLRMDTMRVSEGGGAYLEISVPILSDREQRGYIRGNALNTSVIQNCLLGKSYFKGLLSGQFEITRRDTNLDADGELSLSEIEFHEARFDSLSLTGQIMNERLDGMLSLHNEGQRLIDGEANLPFKLGDPENFPSSFFEEPVSGKIQVRNIAIQQLDSLFADIGITETSGIFSFRGTLDGRAGDPEFTGDASLKNASLSGVTVDSVTAGVNYRHKEGEVELDASVMSLRQRAALINARFPLLIDMKSFRVDLPQTTDSIEVNMETNNFNLQALNDFLDRRTLRQVAGQLNGFMQVKGAMNDLKTDGKLVLRNGAFRLVPAGIKVDHIRSTIHFDHNQIRLSNFSASSGKGDMKAHGKVAIDKLVPGELDLAVEAQNFRIVNTSQYNAIVNVDAQTKGSFTRPKVTGSIDFISGFLKLQNFGEKSVETIELDSLADNGPQVSIYDSLALDMDVAFNRRFNIQNQRYLEMEIALSGELDLQKDIGRDLELFGTIVTPNGYARPFGKEFKLEEGTITFSGAPANPQLRVRTRFEPPQPEEDIVIWYIIEGTVEDPQFKYESQPPMELENIISYTLFGQPFYALDSWKQVVASSGNNTTAADVALDVMLDRVEALATQKLGIDVVKIENSRVGRETGTSITTGWYLNPKVFFAIQNVITGSTPDTGFLLEYDLQKNLKLILRQGNGIRQGMDLEWNYDY